MNTRLLRRVAAHISEVPDRFVMGNSLAKGETITDVVFLGEVGKDGEKTIDFTVKPPCGTACCIAGASFLLTSPEEVERLLSSWSRMIPWSIIKEEAVNNLAITDDQAERLFHVHNWPAKFRTQFSRAKTQRGRVNVGVARIEHFIKTKGAE